jgi:hypothetical protein
MSYPDAPTQEAEVFYEGRHRRNDLVNTCAECGRADPDTEVGWSLCGTCFHSDQFNGAAYWVPLWCGLLFLTGIGVLIAAIVVLTG